MDNYSDGVCGSGHILTTNISPGDTRYDAATANMGSPWKMFTQAQGDELINGTNHMWTTINGVNGMKFTSKTDSTKYIFLPAAGEFGGTMNASTEEYGFYWTTTIDLSFSPPIAFRMQLHSTSEYTGVSSSSRHYGGSIRPVK